MENDILKVLPQRFPFLMVDMITESEDNNIIVGIKNVSQNEAYFQGHFPNNPIMPGVLIVEALAQTGSVLILSMPENKNKIAYLAEIRKARFYKKVKPGDVITMRIEIIKKTTNFIKMFGKAECNGEKCATAELICAIQ